MCGLFGLYSTSLRDEEISDALFLGLLSTTRGIDSTGYAVFGKGKKNKTTMRVHRKADDFLSFMKDQAAYDAKAAPGRFCLMGHTRWATLGAVNLRNAHPIEEGGIVLCHNGSVDHFCKDKKSEVDSDSREIARRLTKGDLAKTMGEIGHGAAAMTYVDLQRQTFNMVRNTGRTLFYMYNTGRTTMYWASTVWMLNALKEKESKNSYGEIFDLAPLVQNTWRLQTMERKTNRLVLPPIKIEDSSPFRGSQWSRGASWCSKCHHRTDFCTCEDEKTYDTSGTVPSIGPIRQLPAPSSNHVYQGYKGVKLSVGAVKPFLNKGCITCRSPGLLIRTSKWIAEDAFICESCWDKDDIVKKHVAKDCPVYDGYLVTKEGVKWENKHQ